MRRDAPVELRGKAIRLGQPCLERSDLQIAWLAVVAKARDSR
jgi:hypothetical protein